MEMFLIDCVFVLPLKMVLSQVLRLTPATIISYQNKPLVQRMCIYSPVNMKIQWTL